MFFNFYGMNITFGFILFSVFSLMGFILVFKKSKSTIGWGPRKTWDTDKKSFLEEIFGENYPQYVNLIWAIVNLIIAAYILYANNK